MIKYFLILTIICGLLDFSYAEVDMMETSEVVAPVDEPIKMMTPPEKPSVTSSEKLVEKLPEEQIPLALAADKQISSAEVSMPTGTRALASGVIIILLLAVSYYYVSKYKISNKINKSNLHIKVLSQHYLGPKKSLAVVHVAGESILLGITETNISMIKSLSLIDDEVPAEMPQTFNESLNQTLIKGESSVNKAPNTSVNMLSRELDEEFSFSGVTDKVSKKIKSMRSLS